MLDHNYLLLYIAFAKDNPIKQKRLWRNLLVKLTYCAFNETLKKKKKKFINT